MIQKPIRGTVHGRTIELSEEPGYADGAEVEVQLRTLANAQIPGAGFLRTEGALAEDGEWDEIMDKIEAARKTDTGKRIDWS